jgi:opacity protein-like surface antigen
MMKMMVLGALMLSAAAGYAQESRQDVSLSGTGVISPSVHGANPVALNPTKTGGLLASYRYMLTPHSALEVNYGYAQNTNKFTYSSDLPVGIHTLQQEFSAAYVYSRNYGNYSPFLEAGPGVMIFSPIRDAGTGTLDAKRNTNIGALFGGGLAYELSPSFDIRVEYRGFLVKAPSFEDKFKTNRYTVVSTPSLGFAYHF